MPIASCHCGDVRIEIADKPGSLTECNCSICRRYGVLWAYCTKSTAKVEARPESLEAYIWGDRCIEFYHCRRCGCLTHSEAVDKSDDYRIAVNGRMLDPEDIQGVERLLFDGADSWQYIDR